jgi:hypothetical protein
MDLYGFTFPKVNFLSIKLSGGTDLPKGTDEPHIDQDETGKVIPANVVNTSDQIEQSPDPMKVEVILGIEVGFGNKTENLLSSFFANDFTKFLKIKVGQSTDPQQTNLIINDPDSWRSAGGVASGTENSSDIPVSFVGFSTWSGYWNLEESTATASSVEIKTDSDGNKVYVFPYKFTFIISESDGGVGIQHLAYFANAYFDIDNMIQEENLLSGLGLNAELINSIAYGQVTSQVVIQGGSIKSTSQVFYENPVDANGNILPIGFYNTIYKNTPPPIWTGPVHYHGTENPGPNGYIGYMAGVGGDDMGAYLTAVDVPNGIIQDFREVVEIEKIDFDYSLFSNSWVSADTVESLTNNLKGIKDLASRDNQYTLDTPDIEKAIIKSLSYSKNEEIFTDFYSSLDGSGRTRFAFGLDIKEAVKQNSAFPLLVDNMLESTDLMNQKLITSFKVFRNKVNKYNPADPTVDLYEVVLNSDTKAISTTEDNEDGVLKSFTLVQSIEEKTFSTTFGEYSVTTTKNAGAIRQIPLYLKEEQNSHIKYYTGADLDPSNDGDYTYSVEITMEDPIVPWMKNVITVFEDVLYGKNQEFLDDQQFQYNTILDQISKFEEDLGLLEDILNYFDIGIEYPFPEIKGKITTTAGSGTYSAKRASILAFQGDGEVGIWESNIEEADIEYLFEANGYSIQSLKAASWEDALSAWEEVIEYTKDQLLKSKLGEISVFQLLNNTINIGFSEYLQDSKKNPEYFNSYTNRFTTTGIDSLLAKYGSPYVDGTISQFFAAFRLLTFIEGEKIVSMENFLKTISSFNYGSPSGVQQAFDTMETIYNKILNVFASASKYKKPVDAPQVGFDQKGKTIYLAAGSNPRRDFVIQKTFDVKIDESINYLTGYDYLSIDSTGNEQGDAAQGLKSLSYAQYDSRTTKELQKIMPVLPNPTGLGEPNSTIDIYKEPLADSSGNDNVPQGTLLNPNDSVTFTKSAFLSPSIINFAGAPSQNMLNGGNIRTDVSELNNVLLNILRKNAEIQQKFDFPKTNKVATGVGDQVIDNNSSIELKYDLLTLLSQNQASVKSLETIGLESEEDNTSSGVVIGDATSDFGLILNLEASELVLPDLVQSNQIFDIFLSSIDPTDILLTTELQRAFKLLSDAKWTWEYYVKNFDQTFYKEYIKWALQDDLETTPGNSPLKRSPNHVKALMLYLDWTKNLNAPSFNALNEYLKENKKYAYDYALSQNSIPYGANANDFLGLKEKTTDTVTPIPKSKVIYQTPEFMSFFLLNYKKLVRVEALIGYGKGIYGKAMLNSPMWSVLDEDLYQQLANVGKNVMCRMVPHENTLQGIEQYDLLHLPMYDQHFIVRFDEAPPESPFVPMGQTQSDPQEAETGALDETGETLPGGLDPDSLIPVGEGTTAFGESITTGLSAGAIVDLGQPGGAAGGPDVRGGSQRFLSKNISIRSEDLNRPTISTSGRTTSQSPITQAGQNLAGTTSEQQNNLNFNLVTGGGNNRGGY